MYLLPVNDQGAFVTDGEVMAKQIPLVQIPLRLPQDWRDALNSTAKKLGKTTTDLVAETLQPVLENATGKKLSVRRKRGAVTKAKLQAKLKRLQAEEQQLQLRIRELDG